MTNHLLPKLEDWRFVGLDPKREMYLQEPIDYSVLVLKIVQDSIVSEPRRDCCDDNRKDAPGFGAARWIWRVTTPPKLFDLFYNSRFGLRAHYWVSAESGKKATKTFLEAMDSRARSMCSEQIRVLAMESYSSDSSKVWPSEEGLEGERALTVERWAASEMQNNTPHQWRWTPCHGQLEIKGGFRHPDGREHVPISKQDREDRIHLTGWSGQRPYE